MVYFIFERKGERDRETYKYIQGARVRKDIEKYNIHLCR